MNRGKPPSLPAAARAPMFRVGRDSQGHWVVQDQHGLRGGLFIDRTEALKFAMFENGNRPQAVIMVAGVLELDLSGRSCTHPAAANTQAPLRRPA